MMDEIKKFLGLLKKYLIALIVIPLLTIVITYFLVRNQPNSYVSQVQIATGIVDDTQHYQEISILNESMLQGEQARQQFSNLISQMRIKKVLDKISFKLIIHDLKNGSPFIAESDLVKGLDVDARRRAIEIYEKHYLNNLALNISDKDQNKLNEILKSMGYDSETLAEHLNIFRVGDSDFIAIQYESKSSELSAFVVNALASEFIGYYSELVKNNKIKTTNFLELLLKEKTDTLNKRMAVLKNYKIKNRVLNLDEQSKQLYSRIVEYDNKKQEAIQMTSSYAGALSEIDRKFSPSERKYIEYALSKVNQDIVTTRQELSTMYDLYYSNDFDDKYKTSMDSLSHILESQISKSSDQYLTSPLAAKQAMVQQKMELEVQLDLSRYGINVLEREINLLNNQFDMMVPKEAEVQTYEMAIDIATKEYTDVLDKFNQSSLESSISSNLNIVQAGMPGVAQPSKKMLLVLLSGIISLVFCLVIFFVLYLFDRSIISQQALADSTGLPVIGVIDDINMSSIDLKLLWSDNDLPAISANLKNQLRSLRFDLENELNGKILLINSLVPNEGKTFLSMSLAFAWTMTGKKILVIDGNFNNPKISEMVNSSLYLEDFLQNKIDITSVSTDNLSIMKNRGGDISLMELATEGRIVEKLHALKTIYDVVIIETAALEVINQSREWILFSDKMLTVFEYGKSLSGSSKSSVDYLKSTNKSLGFVLNRFRVNN
jgi:succinoglycan biosynthesis transport protein ExoP